MESNWKLLKKGHSQKTKYDNFVAIKMLKKNASNRYKIEIRKSIFLIDEINMIVYQNRYFNNYNLAKKYWNKLEVK